MMHEDDGIERERKRALAVLNTNGTISPALHKNPPQSPFKKPHAPPSLPLASVSHSLRCVWPIIIPFVIQRRVGLERRRGHALEKKSVLKEQQEDFEIIWFVFFFSWRVDTYKIKCGLWLTKKRRAELVIRFNSIKTGAEKKKNFPGKIGVERFDNHSFSYLGLWAI
jgi:hypothetical protein